MTIAATLLNDTDVKHLGNHTDSVANQFTLEIKREVARDVVTSYKVWL